MQPVTLHSSSPTTYTGQQTAIHIDPHPSPSSSKILNFLPCLHIAFKSLACFPLLWDMYMYMRTGSRIIEKHTKLKFLKTTTWWSSHRLVFGNSWHMLSTIHNLSPFSVNNSSYHQTAHFRIQNILNWPQILFFTPGPTLRLIGPRFWCCFVLGMWSPCLSLARNSQRYRMSPDDDL